MSSAVQNVVQNAEFDAYLKVSEKIVTTVTKFISANVFDY